MVLLESWETEFQTLMYIMLHCVKYDSTHRMCDWPVHSLNSVSQIHIF